MTESRLKLPIDELRTLYTRHLLLQGLVNKDVSLYVLSLGYKHTREKTVYLAANNRNHTETETCWQSLCQLESRYVDGVVAYHYAMFACCMSSVRREYKRFLYENAYQLLVSRDTPTELYYVARLLKETDWNRYNVRKAIRLLERAAGSGSIDALLHLGGFYKARGTLVDFIKALNYYRDAIDLNSTKAMLDLAQLLECVLPLRKHCSLSFLDLYKQAALKGDAYAIIKCCEYAISLL